MDRPEPTDDELDTHIERHQYKLGYREAPDFERILGRALLKDSLERREKSGELDAFDKGVRQYVLDTEAATPTPSNH